MYRERAGLPPLRRTFGRAANARRSRTAVGRIGRNENATEMIGYRPLLEAGVRIFEWNGTMLHANTAVADASWSRIGSSNLNPFSWWGNWELDVAVEDEGFAGAVADMFLRDLRHSTKSSWTCGVASLERRHASGGTAIGGDGAARAVAGAVGLGRTVGAALTNRRPLTPTEARVLVAAGMLFSVLATVAVAFQRAVAWAVALVACWIALTVCARAVRLYARAGRRRH